MPLTEVLFESNMDPVSRSTGLLIGQRRKGHCFKL